MKSLTIKQKELVDFIEKFQKKNKEMPTKEKMAKHIGFTTACVVARLVALTRKRYIKRENNLYIILK